MIFVDEIKKEISMMLHPSKADSMSIGQALSFYYKLAFIPLILSLILMILIYVLGNAIFPGPSLLVSSHAFAFGWLVGLPLVLILLLVVLVGFLVLFPISILLTAGIFHLFGKFLFKIYKSDYKDTVTGVMYASGANILVYWLIAIPILGSFIGIIFSIWSLIILILALAKLQKTSGLASFGVIFGSAVVIVIIVVVVSFLIFFSAMGYFVR